MSAQNSSAATPPPTSPCDAPVPSLASTSQRLEPSTRLLFAARRLATSVPT